MTSNAPSNGTTLPQRPRGLARALLFLLAVAVAGLLGFAAFAKATTKPPATSDYLGWAQIVGEVVVALLILAMHRRAWAWGFIAVLFAAFTGYTMHRLFGGARSCGCFGKFSVPPATTLTIDAAVVALALAATIALRLHRALTWLVASALLPAAIVGALYGQSQPTPDDFKPGSVFERAAQERAKNRAGAPPGAPAPDGEAAPVRADAPAFDPLSMRPADVLMLVPDVQEEFLAGATAPGWLARLTEAAAERDGPAWLVFVYDPNCDVCQRFLPFYSGYEQASANDALLRVVTVQKGDLTKFGIEDWAWAHSPMTLLVHRGEIIHEWGGEDTPMPGAIRGRIETEGEAFLDGMQATYAPLE